MKKLSSMMTGILMAMMIALTFSVQASAATVCKGKSKSQCASSSDCSWVSSYKTKSGAKVSGYCRAKPGKAASSKAKKKISTTRRKAASKSKTVKEKASKKSAKAKKSAKKTKKSAKKLKSKAKKAKKSSK